MPSKDQILSSKQRERGRRKRSLARPARDTATQKRDGLARVTYADGAEGAELRYQLTTVIRELLQWAATIKRAVDVPSSHKSRLPA